MFHAMAMVASYLSAKLPHFGDERAQDTFEYIIIIGVVTVAVVLAMVTPVGSSLVSAVVSGTCNAVASLPNMTMTCP